MRLKYLFVGELDNIGSNTFDNTYITGSKLQSVAFSRDLSRAYVAGNGVVYAIDLVNFKLIDKIATPGGKNIVSLSIAGDYLLIGEGSSYGSGPGSDVLVLDLGTLDLKTGKIDGPVKADFGGSGNVVQAPQTVTATNDRDRFLVTSLNDYNHGLSTLTLTRAEATGQVTAAKMVAIQMNQPGNALRRDRLNIQRAQSAVLVEKDGVEYAIVSDDNHPFDDPYVRAMYEAPEFIQLSPFGPPTPIGGSASAKKVSAGGKLGFVKDPFGKLGEPVFMGATLPLDGYGIVNLGLSEDGQVLIGQLKGGFSANIFDGAQKDHMNLAWNVGTLLDAAIAMPEQDRLSKHIVLAASASQLIPVPTTASGYVAAPAGTKFDPIDVKVAYEGRMGDVLDVDLKTLIADWAARELLGWKNAQEFPESAMAGDERRILRDIRARWLQEGTGAEQFFLLKFRHSKIIVSL